MDPFSNQQPGPQPYYEPQQAVPPAPQQFQQPQFMQQPEVRVPELPHAYGQHYTPRPETVTPPTSFAPPEPQNVVMPQEAQMPQAPPVPEMPAPLAPAEIAAATFASAPSLPPAPPASIPAELRPTPVVKVLSPVGVEYVFLTLTLLAGASALASALLVLVNGSSSFSALAFPAAALIVTVPLFALIFLHLKRQELNDPGLKLDPSKRRSTQFTQIIAFVVCLSTLIGFFAAVMASLGGGSHTGVGKAALDALCVLGVAGGILAYYWHDEHRSRP